MDVRSLCFALAVSGCAPLAWDTTIAETPDRRRAMVESVEFGKTTETAFVTRWGAPTQRVREGGQTELIYRSMENPPGYYSPQFGDSANYVIVTFQYGHAVGIRTSDTEGCRATFRPRPAGPGDWNLSTVHPTENCPGVGPLQGRVHPIDAAIQEFLPPGATTARGSGTAATSEAGPSGKAGPFTVTSDRYGGGGKAE
ncbi:MAG: hypothetical protein AAF871_17085 [Pseudomonadota bacterium]